MTLLLRHYDNAYRFLEFDPATQRIGRRRLRNVSDVVRRRAPVYYGMYKTISGITCALYVNNNHLNFLLDQATVQLGGTNNAVIRASGDNMKRFVLRDGDMELLELQFDMKSDLLAPYDTTPFHELVNEHFLEFVAEVVNDDERRGRMSASWADGLTRRSLTQRA